MPATATYNLTGNAYIDGVLGGVKWAVNSLTFSFPTSGSFYESGYGDGEPTNNFGALNATQQATARSALGMYAAVANLTFTEMTETSSQHGDLRFAMSDAPSTAWAYFPSPAPEGGDVWFNKANGYYASPQRGNYAHATFMHEIGHALGLDHPQEGTVMPADRDSLEYTVMSYRSYVGASSTSGYVNETWGYPQSPMMYDIAAVQHMYGANFATYSGSTTYSWSPTTGEMFINGVGQGAPGANRIFLTVWDGGGVDTYDFSNYGTALTVNLQPGAWTTTSSAQLARLHYDGSRLAVGNIANALLYNGDLRSLIENALGGSGSDSLVGNQVANQLSGGAGDDRLTGGAGDDSLDGGAGSDTAVFGGARADYRIVQVSGGSTQVSDLRSGAPDGTDLTTGIEYFQFSNGTYAASALIVSGMTLTGDEGNNTLVGGVGDDQLDGRGGQDNLYGEDGNDVIQGGEGDDLLSGGRGDDTLYGGNGGDTLVGDDGADWLDGGGGVDLIYGGAGADAIIGGADFANNYLNGGAGVDSITGAGGTDVIEGGPDNDTIRGGEGDNSLYGDAGDDVITAGAGIDLLVGGAGNDNLSGGAGNDQLGGDTEDGNDTLNGGAGVDVLYGGEGVDLLVGGDGNDGLYGGNGNDTVNGGNGNDTLVGDLSTPTGGADVLNGEAGDDILLGYTGNDTLNGGDGNDRLYGYQDNDGLNGGAGADYLYGGVGDDRLVGGAGNDQLFGQAGNDTFAFLAAGFGTDYIWDFVGGAGPSDRLEFSTTLFANEAQVRAASTYNGSNTTITSGADQIVLVGVNIANMTSDDFLFV